MLTENSIKLDGYFELIKNLRINDKAKLITQISNSIIEEHKTNEEALECFGAFESDKTAEELISDIYNSRNFKKKDIEL